eukprot:CAMPEP_0179155978 /NCGR_PEP_ID=MMETSP0796-20121207/76010_1 /TAXON_ID=73915 /ORGANISM="Pyrodinium bahamense, Strain pbaha01" /LENGTH=129 /DNA_ID=CAMNT_0020857509 /DNA_START=27 /DNA_END=412 /DNA_ORIENTATION=-
MMSLPSDVKAYKRTRTFSCDDCPEGLLRKHNTKKGTWGLIHVEVGSLRYTIFDGNGDEGPDYILAPEGQPGVIEPTVYHKVELLSPDTRFHVEFFGSEGTTVAAPRFLGDLHREQSVVNLLPVFIVGLA